jgi:hypothetical protein
MHPSLLQKDTTKHPLQPPNFAQSVLLLKSIPHCLELLDNEDSL